MSHLPPADHIVSREIMTFPHKVHYLRNKFWANNHRQSTAEL